jgi:hypothetical protein
MSEFQYYNSPDTTFTVLDGGSRDFDNKHNTVTYHNRFEVENLTEQAVDDVFAFLPYIWAVAPDDGVNTHDGKGTLGPAGPVALDFEDGAWTTEDFNGIEGLDLRVTAKIVPLNHLYTTSLIAAGGIASDASLTDDFGPSSADDPLNSKKLPPEMLDGDDLMPSVNLGTLEAFEDVTVDLVFTYNWTLDGKKVDYNALPTSGAVYTLDAVESSPPTADAVGDLWLV